MKGIVRAFKKLKRKKLKISKAGLREHIEHRKKSGKKRRIYKNEKGEVFFVERPVDRMTINNGEISVVVEVFHPEKELFADGQVIVRLVRKEVHIHGANIVPEKIGMKGRGIIDIFVDEARELGAKHFRKKDFTITIVPRGDKKELRKYYASKGFESIPGEAKMRLKP